MRSILECAYKIPMYTVNHSMYRPNLKSVNLPVPEIAIGVLGAHANLGKGGIGGREWYHPK